MLLRKICCRHLTRCCLSTQPSSPLPTPPPQSQPPPQSPLSLPDQEVISFQPFIRYHSKIMKRPPGPVSRIICCPNTDYDYDEELGRYFCDMLQFYLDTHRVREAGALLRSVVCPGNLHNQQAVSEMSRDFVDVLNMQFTKLPTEEYLDVALHFYKQPLYRMFIKSVLSKMVTDNNDDVIKDKLSSLREKLEEFPDKYHLLSALHTVLASWMLKSEQYQYLHHVEYRHLYRDTAVFLYKRYYALRRYSDVVQLVKENGTRNNGLVYMFYKRAVRDSVLSEPEMRDLEEWMEKEGFGEGIVERRSGGEEGTGREERKEETSEVPWDDLNHM